MHLQQSRLHFLLVLTLYVLASACQGTSKQSTLLPSMLTPPGIFADLPIDANIECPNEEYRQGSIALWREIAQHPSDDSSTNPERGGDPVGYIEHCTIIIVIDYEWSEFSQEFWLLIEDSTGNRGWLPAQYVEFDN